MRGGDITVDDDGVDDVEDMIDPSLSRKTRSLLYTSGVKTEHNCSLNFKCSPSNSGHVSLILSLFTFLLESVHEKLFAGFEIATSQRRFQMWSLLESPLCREHVRFKNISFNFCTVVETWGKFQGLNQMGVSIIGAEMLFDRLIRFVLLFVGGDRQVPY